MDKVMSYYTIIRPKWELDGESLEEIAKERDHNKQCMDIIWSGIADSFFIAPSSAEELANLSSSARQTLDKYCEYYGRWWENDCIYGMIEDNDNGVYYNKFPYNDDPERGIGETKNDVDYVIQQIIGHILARPIDIVFGIVTDDLVTELVNKSYRLRDALDEKLALRCFCELAAKNWESHEEG